MFLPSMVSDASMGNNPSLPDIRTPFFFHLGSVEYGLPYLLVSVKYKIQSIIKNIIYFVYSYHHFFCSASAAYELSYVLYSVKQNNPYIIIIKRYHIFCIIGEQIKK